MLAFEPAHAIGLFPDNRIQPTPSRPPPNTTTNNWLAFKFFCVVFGRGAQRAEGVAVPALVFGWFRRRASVLVACFLLCAKKGPPLAPPVGRGENKALRLRRRGNSIIQNSSPARGRGREGALSPPKPLAQQAKKIATISNFSYKLALTIYFPNPISSRMLLWNAVESKKFFF
jgi:hypothetical protein